MNPREPWERVGSRLPDDPAYWDALAGRIQAAAAGDLSRLQDRAPPWWSDLARHSRGLALLAAAALVAALTLFPRPRPAQAAPSPLERTIQPTDPGLIDLLGGPGPPSLEALFVEEGGTPP